MDFTEFTFWLGEVLAGNTFCDYTNYKMRAKTPKTQEWSELVRRLDGSPDRGKFVKVRRGSKRQIAFADISKLDDLRAMERKGLLTIEWAGKEEMAPSVVQKKPGRLDALVASIDEIQAQLAQIASIDLVGRVARLEASVYGNKRQTEESRSSIYEIVSMLLPYLIEEGEELTIGGVLDRAGTLQNFTPRDSHSTVDRLTLLKAVLDIARDRQEVFSVRDNGLRDIGSWHISINNGDNLIMLRVYPKQGSFYNLHHLGGGRSPITESLITTMRGEFNKMREAISSFRSEHHVTQQMIFTIACGVANPTWYFGTEATEVISHVNKQLTTLGYQLVQSNGIWFMTRTAPRETYPGAFR